MATSGDQAYVVRVEHPVLDYDRWKAAFDSDPAGRAQAGVRRYRVLREADDPNVVTIDLDFDTRAEADAMLVSLQALWGRVTGVLITGPQGRVLEVAESVDL
jgi:hypothetical protein